MFYRHEEETIMPKFCSKCGTEAIEGDTFCSKCGFNLKENIYQVEKSVSVKKDSEISIEHSNVVFRDLILGIGLLIIGIFGYLYTQSEIEKLESLIGSLSRVLSSDLRNKYEFLKNLNILSILAIIFGGIVTILNAISYNRKNS